MPHFMIGWLSDAQAQQLRRQGACLRFMWFSRRGTPVHQVVRAR